MASPRPSTDRSTTDTHASSDPPSSHELAAVVDDLLNQLNAKFTAVSSELLNKMDDMSRRIDNLEAAIQGSAGAKGSGAGK